jgi:oligopeptide transport system substrate-binding protein
MHRILTSILILCLFCGVMPAAAQPDTPLTLRVAMNAPENLDPVQVSRFDLASRDVIENLFVGLTRFNPLTRQIDPMIADSWSVSDDGLTWTFNLREDIQWVRYDPNTQEALAIRPVAAGDFVFAIQRACDPLRPSPLTANLMIIRGCQTVANAFPEVVNDLFIAREIGARATGPHTLVIDLLFPSSYFLTLTSTPEYRPLAREVVSGKVNLTNASPVMTNGPYALQNWTDSGMVLVRNTHWPDSFSGNIERIDVTFANENAAALFNSQQVDLARLTPDEAANARAASPDLLHIAEGQSMVMLGFSFDRALVNSPDIRRALSFALNRDALVSQFFPDQARATTQFTPAGVVAAPDFNGLEFDPAQAQAALSAAGFSGCTNWPEKLIVLVPDDDPLWAELGQAIIEQWASQLGCNPALFEIRTLPRTLMIELSHSNYDPEKVTRSHIWLANWSGDYLDANNWLGDALHCQFGYIKTGRACDNADALIDQAANEMDTAQRATIYAQVEEQFFGPNGSFPVIPLFFTTAAWLQQPELTGVNEFGPARYDLWMLDNTTQEG